MKTLKFINFSLVLLILTLVACTADQKPQVVVYGKDVCEHCHMVITDQRFGAQLITEKGKHFLFDSVNCLHRYFERHPRTSEQIYFVDSIHRNQWVNEREVRFSLIPSVRSPMGAGLFSLHSEAEITAIPEAQQADKNQLSKGIMTWEQVRTELSAGRFN